MFKHVCLKGQISLCESVGLVKHMCVHYLFPILHLTLRLYLAISQLASNLPS